MGSGGGMGVGHALLILGFPINIEPQHSSNELQEGGGFMIIGNPGINPPPPNPVTTPSPHTTNLIWTVARKLRGRYVSAHLFLFPV